MPDDLLYWWPSKGGVFTVKSAYWLGMRGRIGQQGDLWRQIWALNAPPKLRHFAWRACNNTLAVRANLWRRHIIDDASCAVCGAATEDVVHTLLECNAIQEVWNGFEYRDIINNAPGNDGARNLDTILQLFDAKGKCDFLVRAWASWMVRNSHYFEESPALPSQVVAGFLRLVDDYQTYAHMVFLGERGPIEPLRAYWTPPPCHAIKLNVDAAIFGGGSVGLGMVGRNSEGKVVVMASCMVVAEWEPSIAESMAARYGILMARSMGVEHLILESDSVNLIRAIVNRKTSLDPGGLVVDDILDLFQFFTAVDCMHVKREGNTVAHSVARLCFLSK